MKKKLLAIFGCLFLVLYFFLSKNTLSDTIDSVNQLQLQYWLYGFIFILFTTFFAGYRYKLLLKKESFDIPLFLLVKDTIICLSLNVYSVIGLGEVYKAKKLIDYGVPLHRSSSLVLIDRLIGMLSLCFIISFLSVFSVYDGFDISTRNLNIGVVIVLVVIIILFFFKKRIMDYFSQNKAFAEVIDILMMDPQVFFSTLFVSVISQLCTVVATYYVGIGIGLSLDIFVYLVCVPVAGLMAVLPISIGGLGVREVSYVYILKHYGVEKGSAIALGLLQYSFYIGLSFVGIALWLAGKKRNQRDCG